MTVAVIILAIALAGAIAGLITFGIALRSSLAREGTAKDDKEIAGVAQRAAESERDQALATAAQMKRERDDAVAVSESAMRAANTAREEMVRNVKAKLLSGSIADAAHYFNELLASPVLSDPAAPAAAAGGDHGDAKPPAV